MRIIAACNTIDDLATCCKQLIYALKRTDSKSDAGDRAMNFLQRHNLIGSPLRDQQETRHMVDTTAALFPKFPYLT